MSLPTHLSVRGLAGPRRGQGQSGSALQFCRVPPARSQNCRACPPQAGRQPGSCGFRVALHPGYRHSDYGFVVEL